MNEAQRAVEANVLRRLKKEADGQIALYLNATLSNSLAETLQQLKDAKREAEGFQKAANDLVSGSLRIASKLRVIERRKKEE